MSRWFADADAGRLRARAFAGARGPATTLDRLREAGQAAAAFGSVGRHVAWVGARPVIAELPVWGTALGRATALDPPPEADASGRRRGRRGGTPPVRTAASPPPTRPHPAGVPAGSAASAAGARGAAAARSLDPRMQAGHLVALAGEIPALWTGGRFAPGRLPDLPMSATGAAAAARPVVLSAAQNESHWRGALVGCALDRIGAAGEAVEVWSVPVAGPRCEVGMLARLAAPDGSGPTEPGPAGAAAAGSDRSVPARAGRDQPPPTDPRHAVPGGSPPASMAMSSTAESPAAGRPEEDESRLLAGERLHGGPPSSLSPPWATPEPDLRAGRTSSAPALGRGLTGPDALPAPGAGSPPIVPVPRDDLGDLIAEILCDEARRHGIDV